MERWSLFDYWRAFAAKFLNAKYVLLIDGDGEMTVRRVWWRGMRPHVTRIGLGIGVCRLLPGGKVVGAVYVKAWEQYMPDNTDWCPND